jgi:tetratricopeptide (TPR) repeat protein
MRCTRALLIFLLASAAHAEDRAAAREHYMKGTKLFKLGHYEDAVKEYDLAYQAKDDPVLLYNIAQAHRLAGHTKDAIFYYKAFLRKSPGNPHTAEVETKIAELQKLLKQQSRAENLNPNDPIPPKGGETETRPDKPRGPEAKPSKPAVVTTAPPPSRPLFENGEAIPPPTAPAPPEETTTPPPANPPPAAATPQPAKPPAAELTKAPPPKDSKPIYKKWWFWTAIGGAAVAIIVVGAAVGAPTNTTIVSDCRFGVGNMNCAR